jgi:hypothetical protein
MFTVKQQATFIYGNNGQQSKTKQDLTHDISQFYCKPATAAATSSLFLSASHYSQYSNGANWHQHQWRSDQYPPAVG